MKYSLKTLLVMIAFIGIVTVYIKLYRSYQPRKALEIPQDNLVVKVGLRYLRQDQLQAQQIFLIVKFPDHEECYVSIFEPSGEHVLSSFQYRLRNKQNIETLEYQRLPDETLRQAMQRRHLQALKILEDQIPLSSVINLKKESHELYVPELAEKFQPTPLPENLAHLAFPKESAAAMCYWSLAKTAELLVQLRVGTFQVEPYPPKR